MLLVYHVYSAPDAILMPYQHDSLIFPTHPYLYKACLVNVQDLVQNRFRKRPCYFQIKVAQAVYAGKDVVACASTGAGKTLTFWIPILMALEEGKDNIRVVHVSYFWAIFDSF